MAAMYEEPDDVEPTAIGDLEDFSLDDGPEPAPLTKAWVDRQAQRGRVQFETDGRFVTLTVDGRKVLVPTASYVKKLEEKIATHDRDMLRIKAMLKAMRTLVNRHEGDINDVWRELDRKMNLRDS